MKCAASLSKTNAIKAIWSRLQMSGVVSISRLRCGSWTGPCQGNDIGRRAQLGPHTSVTAQDAKRCRSRSAGVLKSMPQLTIRTAIEAHGEDYSPIRKHCPRCTAPACPLERLPLHVLERLKLRNPRMPPLKSGFVNRRPGVQSSQPARHHEIKYLADIVQGTVPAFPQKM